MTDTGEDLVEILEEIIQECNWGQECHWSTEKLQEMLRSIKVHAGHAIDLALDLCLVHTRENDR